MRDPFTWALEIPSGPATLSVKGWQGDGIYLCVNDMDEFSPGVAVAVLAPDEARDLISALESAIREVEA